MVVIIRGSIIPTVMNPIIPSMFRAIAGVFMAVVGKKHRPNTRLGFSDLLFDSGMLFQ